jgi:hypothetical protein
MAVIYLLCEATFSFHTENKKVVVVLGLNLSHVLVFSTSNSIKILVIYSGQRYDNNLFIFEAMFIFHP